MLEMMLWLVFFFIMGLLALPLTFFLFEGLRTKGYAFSKILALLIWGYLFWIGNLFGLINKSRSGALTSLLLLTVLSFVMLRSKVSIQRIALWLRDNIGHVIFIETLFLTGILFMVFLRGANPEIIGTEKPMELAFINGILRSETFPPNDPWLSGFSISYYYFGYLIISAIINLLGTGSGVAFNLALIFWFALSATAVAEIVINLISDRDSFGVALANPKDKRKIYFFGAAGAILLLIISNAEGFLEVLHSLGFLWDQTSQGVVDSGFWTWIDIRELTQSPALPFDWDIHRPGGTWWWRASRVLQDYTVQGQSREVINEFPFFAFFLGDLHPHLLAIPFVLLNVTTAYALIKRPWQPQPTILTNLKNFWIDKRNWFLPLIIGSLIFLNTWDFPIYFGLFTLVVLVMIHHTNQSLKGALRDALTILVSLGITSVLLYYPFLMSFSSQAGGILPSLVFQSRSIHLLVMFFPFIMPILIDLISGSFINSEKRDLLKIGFVVLVFFLLAQSAVFIFSWLSIKIPRWLINISSMGINQWANTRLLHSQNFLGIYGGESILQIIEESVRRLLKDPLDIIVLLAMISLGLTLVLRRSNHPKNSHDQYCALSDKFYGIMLTLSALLVLIPEIVYLRDQFGWRMNTIFKFYFQAWILLSISTVYAISKTGNETTTMIQRVISLIVISIGFVYPAYAIKDRFDVYKLNDFSLEGNGYLLTSNVTEYEAVEFLKSVPHGTIVEAVGGSYSGYARISKLTGLPTVLGWPGHELQWRGGGEEIGSRESDIKKLYTTTDWLSAKEILQLYDIRYIYIGDLERNTYNISAEKFYQYLPVIYTDQNVIIFENPDYAE